MAGKARSLGDQIINEETALEMAFRGETIDETDLRSRSRIAALWGVSQLMVRTQAGDPQIFMET